LPRSHGRIERSETPSATRRGWQSETLEAAMADIDRASFGLVVNEWLRKQGLSYRSASSEWPELNPAMLSRAVNGDVLSAANMLLICDLMGVDPFLFLHRDVRPAAGRSPPVVFQKQPVTEIAPREAHAGIASRGGKDKTC